MIPGVGEGVSWCAREGKWIDGGARMVRGGVSISYGLEVGPIQIMAVDGRGEGTVAVDRGGWNGREVWGVVGGPRAT
ncbi:hypothetical protein B296_00024356 [Ensete ventricosum]|uniref:Uncharacterized protein n=1 Tax=Ensete ventricosum TaxID=4639 RepID=A0A427AGT1_ENSVE|nr:hypothetical protein B296_00024356 [Ensete ventricosum]